MNTHWLDFIVFVLEQLMILGMIVLAILLFWRLRRIRKPVLAFIFWLVILLTTLTPLFNVIQSGLPISSLPMWWTVAIILVPAMIVAAYFINPLKSKRYSFDEDELDIEDHTIH